MNNPKAMTASSSWLDRRHTSHHIVHVSYPLQPTCYWTHTHTRNNVNIRLLNTITTSEIQHLLSNTFQDLFHQEFKANDPYVSIYHTIKEIGFIII